MTRAQLSLLRQGPEGIYQNQSRRARDGTKNHAPQMPSARATVFDEALDELLMTTGAREVTLHYRSGIKVVQDAFSSDTRIRIIALPDDEEQLLSSHLA